MNIHHTDYDPNQWLTPLRAAIRLGLHGKLIEKWLKTGLRYSHMPGNVKLIQVKDLNDYIMNYSTIIDKKPV